LTKAPQILHVRGVGITSFGVLIYEPYLGLISGATMPDIVTFG
jgi:hypothetical protein